MRGAPFRYCGHKVDSILFAVATDAQAAGTFKCHLVSVTIGFGRRDSGLWVEKQKIRRGQGPLQRGIILTINVLVLCTGNSARSILGEVLVNELGGDEVRAFSAGSHPVGQVNPGALDKLRREGHGTDGLASKSWDQFSGAGAPAIDVVITVCDNAAGEACPLWNGAPVTVHWGIPDPAADGDFETAYARLRRRVEAMLALPLAEMDAGERRDALARIHEEFS